MALRLRRHHQKERGDEAETREAAAPVEGDGTVRGGRRISSEFELQRVRAVAANGAAAARLRAARCGRERGVRAATL